MLWKSKRKECEGLDMSKTHYICEKNCQRVNEKNGLKYTKEYMHTYTFIKQLYY